MTHYCKEALKEICAKEGWLAFDTDKKLFKRIPKPTLWNRIQKGWQGRLGCDLKEIDQALKEFLSTIDWNVLSGEELEDLSRIDRIVRNVAEKNQPTRWRVFRVIAPWVYANPSKKEPFSQSLPILDQVMRQVRAQQMIEMDSIYSELALQRGLQLSDPKATQEEQLTVALRSKVLDFYRFVQKVAQLAPTLNLMTYEHADWHRLREALPEGRMKGIEAQLVKCAWRPTHIPCQKVLAEAADETEGQLGNIDFLLKYLEKVQEKIAVSAATKEAQIHQALELGACLGPGLEPRNILGAVYGIVGFKSMQNLPCETIQALMDYYAEYKNLIDDMHRVGDSRRILNDIVKQRTGASKLTQISRNEFDCFYAWYRQYVELWKIYARDPAGPVESVRSLIDAASEERYEVGVAELSEEEMEDFHLWAETYQELKEYIHQNPDEVDSVYRMACGRYRRITPENWHEKGQMEYLVNLIHQLTGEEFKYFLDSCRSMYDSL